MKRSGAYFILLSALFTQLAWAGSPMAVDPAQDLRQQASPRAKGAENLTADQLQARVQQERLGACIAYYDETIAGYDLALRGEAGPRVTTDTVSPKELETIVAYGIDVRTYFDFITVYDRKPLVLRYQPLVNLASLGRHDLEQGKKELQEGRELLNELYKHSFGERYSEKNANPQALHGFMGLSREFSKNKPRVLELLKQNGFSRSFCREGFRPSTKQEIADFTERSLRYQHAQSMLPTNSVQDFKHKPATGEKAVSGQSHEGHLGFSSH